MTYKHFLVWIGLVANLSALFGQAAAERVYAFREHGFFHHSSFSFLFGTREDDDTYYFDEFGNYTYSNAPSTGFTVQHITGYQFSRLVGAGLGVSYDSYNVETAESILSVFGHYRGYLTRRIFAPFVGISAGYGFVLQNKLTGIIEGSGGVMLNPELGLRLGAYDKANLTVALGYRFQSADYTREVPWVNVVEYRDITYRRFMLNVGLLF